MRELINHVIRIHTNMILRRSMILLLCIGLNSCKSQQAQSVKDNNLVLLVQDRYSGIDNFETLVVRDQKTLNAFYSRINKARKPGLPIPKIDFSKEMIIVVCMGEQLGDDLPYLAQKREDEKGIVLQINPKTTKEKEHTKLISSPFCVYKMPLSLKEITFTKN